MGTGSSVYRRIYVGLWAKFKENITNTLTSILYLLPLGFRALLLVTVA
jgi:hypothetical protein